MAWKSSLVVALLLSAQARALDIDMPVERQKIPMIVARVEPVIVVKPVVAPCVKLKSPAEQLASWLMFWRWFGSTSETRYTTCVVGSKTVVDHYDVTAVAVTGERVTFPSAVRYPVQSVVYY